MWSKILETACRYVLAKEKAGVPLQAYYVVNDKCNLQCKACNFWKGIYHKENRDILSTAEIKEFILKLSKLGVPYLLFTGGEPFLREDMLEILEYAVSKIEHVRVQTNGTLITADKAERLVRQGIDEVWLSIDGIGPTHDMLRSQSGCFERVIQSLNDINNFKIKYRKYSPYIIIHVIVTKYNINEIIDILDLGVKYGAGEIFLSYVTDISAEATNKTENILNYSGFTSRQFFSERSLSTPSHKLSKEIMRKISYIKNKKGIKIFVDPLLRSGGILRPRKRCILLWSSIMISPYGELLVCPMLDKFVIGDLAKEGIMKLWNSAGLNRIRNLVSKKQLPICEECCVQRRDIFDHLKDPANFKRVFVTRKTRRSIYQHRIHI